MSRQPLDKELIQRMVGDLNRASDKNVILKILTKIRSDLWKSKDFRIFRESLGLQALVPFIKRPSKHIIDLALSILANCCLDEDCVQEVMKLNLIPHLILLLKTIPNQSILCRTCRLLGNLATDKKNTKCIQDGNLVTALVSLLDEDGNEGGTLLMITRLIGKMWRLDSFQVDAYLYGIIKRITLALIKLSETRSTADSKDEPPPSQAAETTTVSTTIAFNPKRLQRESNQVFNSMENNHEQSSIQAFQRVASKTTPDEPKPDEFTLPVRNSEREVISCLLKCIQMAAYSKTYQFSEQIVSNPASLRCLLFYCQGASPFRAGVLHIISSLSFNPAVRYAIGSANGVDVILNLLKSTSEDVPTLTDSEYKYCMNIICLLAGDSCNRAKIRHCGGMRILLKRFRDTTNPSERDMILFGLSIFAHDQMSVHLLVREGLINTLLRRMTIELDAMSEYHTPVTIKSEDTEKVPKMKRKSSKLDPSGTKLKRPNYGRLSPTGTYSDAAESPSSCSGYGSMSNRSPSYSSYSSPQNADFDSDADSATYSPVCSDAEDHLPKEKEMQDKVELSGMYDEVEEVAEEDPESVEEETVFVLPLYEEDATSSEKVDEEEVDLSQEMKLWNKSVIKKMLVLLKDMRLRIRRVPDLAKGENLSVLLRACQSIPEPVQYCQLILSFIVQDTENFVNLMQTNFIIDLYNLRHPTVAHANCRLCSDMRSISVQVLENVSTIAESGYGRGELAHHLLTGEKSTQKHVAMVTALVVRDPKFLYSLLFEHNALKIVMEEIMDDAKGARSEEACLGITALARNLKLFLEDNASVDDKENSENEEELARPSGPLELKDFPMQTASDSKITFVLSDGERIVFNEEILTSYSEVFNSMFSRDFQESKFKEVVINDVSAGGLKYFLQLVQHFHGNPEPRNSAHIPKTEKITWALEAYELSIMYMLCDIEKNVLQHIKKLVDDGSVQDMLEWSMKNNNADMLEMSIYYFLNSDLPGARKLKMFRRANESVYSKEWNNWIVDTIKTRCRAALGLITLME